VHGMDPECFLLTTYKYTDVMIINLCLGYSKTAASQSYFAH
jgi:hypothetical protein